MDKDKLSINSLAAHIDYSSQEKVSDNIERYKVRIMYEGKNPNGSYFTETVMRRMARTIGGVPVVGHYSHESGDFLGHGDLVISMTNDGPEVRREGPTPYGFVPHNAEVWYETHLDKDGIQRKYMTTDVYLWTGRYKELDILKYGMNNQSMELDPDKIEGSYQEIDGDYLYVFEDAAFSALCILGSAVEPAFEGAAVEPVITFSHKQTFIDKLAEMKEELNATFSRVDDKNKSEVEKVEKDKLNVEDNEKVVEEEEVEEIPEDEASIEEETHEENTTEDVVEDETNAEEADEVEDAEEEVKDSIVEEDEAEEDEEDIEPSEEELREIEKSSEKPVDDKELSELIDLGSDIDNSVSAEVYSKVLEENIDLAKKVQTLEEELRVVQEQLGEYKLQEIKEEKEAVFEKYQDDLPEDIAQSLYSKMDDYTVEELEFKVQALAYENLKKNLYTQREQNEVNKTPTNFSKVSGLSLKVPTQKRSKFNRGMGWVDVAVEKKNKG